MNYKEALAYIHAINWTFCKPGLERINTLCEGLGHPERDLKFIHVAGTNGKGSFCSMLSSILTEAGYKTGLYTSPHMVTFNERMRVNGQNIDDDVLAEITSRVRPIADAMTDRPTEFELVTAIAFLYFKQMACDVVILETGLGGRLDATNVIPAPLISVITGIDLDHTAILGDTYAKIAAEKAGIIKQGSAVAVGACNQEALDVILEKADAVGAPVRCAKASEICDCRYSLDGTTFSYGEYKDLFIPLVGTYQPSNCALVTEAVVKSTHRADTTQLFYKYFVHEILGADSGKCAQVAHRHKVHAAIQNSLDFFFQGAYHGGNLLAKNVGRKLREAPCAHKTGSKSLLKRRRLAQNSLVSYMHTVEGAQRDDRAARKSLHVPRVGNYIK